MPQSASRELEAGQRVDRGRIRVYEGSDIAHDRIGAAVLEQTADALAEGRYVGAREWASDDQDDRPRLGRRSKSSHSPRPRPLGSDQPRPPFAVFIKKDRSAERISSEGPSKGYVAVTARSSRGRLWTGR